MDPKTWLLIVVVMSHVVLAERRVITRVHPPPDDCAPVDCTWGEWSAWGPCDQPCGETGVQTRTRSAQTRDRCGGRECDGATEERRACNRGCRNGGAPRLGHCHCKDEHWGRCCENSCTPITHCESLTCTNATDHACRRCVYDRGHGLRAYIPTARDGHRHRVCEKVCSWRADSTYCYPGSCPHTTETCACAPGFTSHNCMTMTSTPSLVHCLVLAERVTKRGSGQQPADSVLVHCDSDDDHVVYTNIDVNRVQIDFKSMFAGPSQTLYPMPIYIAAFRVGIVHAKVEYNVTRGSSVLETSSVSCSDDLSVDKPHQSLVLCERVVAVNTSLQHGDVVHLAMTAEGGGYVKVANYDTTEPATEAARYYTGRLTTRRVRLVVDREPPTHCTETADCKRRMLDIGLPVTSKNTLNVSWDGWSDSLSGIRGYQLEVSRLQIHDSDSLIYRSSSSDVIIHLPANVYRSSVELTQPGVYRVLLTVCDNAGNVERSRRFVIFDDTNSVEITGHVGRTLAVDGSVSGRSGNWLTSTHDQVRVSWGGHFANVFHKTRKMLSRIQPHSPPLHPGYDDVRGQLPVTRSMEAIGHVDGVVKYEVSYTITGHGPWRGRGTWMVVANCSQSLAIALPRQDGDVMRIWVRATDVIGNTKVDSIIVNVDSSPPVIAAVSLVRGDTDGLRVHGHDELYRMTMKLDIYELHSGIRDVEWEIRDVEDNALVYGGGRVPVHVHGDPATCVAPDCYCLPKEGGECYSRHYVIAPNRKQMNVPDGKAGRAYHFVVMATNDAMLKTVYTYEFTIDTTPPTPGYVSDSSILKDDVDFQKSLAVNASWRGFVDRESGVLFYRYVFGDRCFNSTEFQQMTDASMTTITHDTSSSHVMSAPGKSHCTVVAYNGAMTPSAPVCSDGVTVDVTPPEIYAVSIKDAWARDGLVKDDAGSVWYIDRNRNRCLVSELSNDCRERLLVSSQIALFPQQRFCDVAHDVIRKLCRNAVYPGNVTVISQHSSLVLSWLGVDEESGVHDYEVAVSSDGSSVPDIVPFTTTNGQQRAVVSQAVLEENRHFYVHIKAVNKAGIEADSVIGPCVVPTIQPPSNKSITLSVKDNSGTSYLVAGWKDDISTADEQSSVYRISYGIGHSPGTDEVREFASLDDAEKVPDVCNASDSAPSCVAIPVQHLSFHLHDNHTYYLTLKTEGANGLESAVVSQPYLHRAQRDTAAEHKRMIRSAGVAPAHSAPVAGHVYDVTSGTPGVDIDYSTDLHELSASWAFTCPQSDVISYTVSVGKCPTCDDVISRLNYKHKTSLRLTSLSLSAGQRYFTSVTACTQRALCTTAVSDGVIPDDTPPVPGRLLDGFSGEDVDFQSSRTTLSAHWVDFYDLESGLSSMEWRGGTRPGQGDIFPPTKLVVTSKASVTLSQPLPRDKTIYVTLKVFNKAGLWVERTSDGIQIDVTAPVESQQVRLSGDRGSFNEDSQVWTDSLSVEWDITDDESGVVEQYVSVMTQQTTRSNIPTIKLYGDVTSYTFTGLSLNDGDKYRVCVTSCNRAGLCTNSTSRQILVDNSPPAVGDFVDPTNATIMTYENGGSTTLNVTWSGFFDPHCSTETYYLSAGTFYGASDLLQSPALPKKVSAATDDPQTTVLSLDTPIYPDQLVHLTVWAVNQAGLSSAHYHDTFKAVADSATSGTLNRVITCQSSTCASQCTCTSDGQMLCRSMAACRDVTGKSGYAVVDVFDVVNYRDVGGANMEDADFTRTQHSLGATWRTNQVTGVMPVRFDWTVGEDGEAMGEGLLDANIEPVWRETGSDNFAVYTTGSSRLSGVALAPNTLYVFYVRAWYDNVTYAIYRSDGVRVHVLPPAVSRSVSVKEVSEGDSDVDFIDTRTAVTVAWEGVFNDGKSAGMSEFVVRLGTTLGSGDIARKTVRGSVTRHTFSGLALREGDTYYSCVTAVSDAGLTATARSDGVKPDTSPPTTGEVRDGVDVTSDVDFISDSQRVSASWRGFKDDQSYVSNYLWCVGTSLKPDDVMACRKVGLRTHVTETLDTPLTSGTKIFSTVYAVNGAGVKSTHVISDGVTVDTTPAQRAAPIRVQLGSQGASIEAAWSGSFADPESPLVNFQWAIGTTPGGVQLQPFVSVGSRTEARAAGLPLDHVTTVHVTVVAENAAGHRTVARSQPLVLNPLPPRVCCVIDGDGPEDIAFQSTANLTVSWTVADAGREGISCELAIGTTLGGADIRPFSPTSSLSEATVDLGNLVTPGRTVFSTVRCTNTAGLQATATSNGVTIVTSTPDVSNASLHIVALSASYYSSRDVHQADESRLSFKWDGISDQSGIACLQVSIVDAKSDVVVPWRNIPSSAERFAELRGLNLRSYETYQLLLRAINNVGLTSDVITSNVTIEQDAPVFIKDIRSSWVNSYTLLLDWTDSFATNSSLTYSINVGTTEGSNDVVAWKEADETAMTLNGLDQTHGYDITITAINKAGLFTTLLVHA